MKAFKKTVFLALAAAMALSLTACMGNNNEPAATTAPVVPATSQPDAGAAATTAPQAEATGSGFMPDATDGGANGATDGAMGMGAAFDWKTNAPEIEAKINQISEIAESRVIVSGETALVGVKFDSAYQGEMTERIRDMIAEVVNEADPNVKTVAVTAEQADVDAIYGYSDQIRSGQDGNSLMEDIERIVRNATTLR